MAMQETHDETGCSISELCVFSGIPRSAYYKWLNRKESKNERFNGQLLPLIKEAYEEKSGILGLRSICRRNRKNYIKSTPHVTAENVLNREFTSENFREKWLTDVTEMKYGVSSKAYLSARLDLGDKSIGSFVIGHSNNHALVFETFDLAHEQYPDAKPIFHSDRGYQYTSKSFKKKLDNAGITQSMSRVSRCIGNGPMEGFWGMLKSEMYYLKTFHTYEELKQVVTEYIDYYNGSRYQKRLNCMTPLEYRHYLQTIAA